MVQYKYHCSYHIARSLEWQHIAIVMHSNTYCSQSKALVLSSIMLTYELGCVTSDKIIWHTLWSVDACNVCNNFKMPSGIITRHNSQYHALATLLLVTIVVPFHRTIYSAHPYTCVPLLGMWSPCEFFSHWSVMSLVSTMSSTLPFTGLQVHICIGTSRRLLVQQAGN